MTATIDTSFVRAYSDMIHRQVRESGSKLRSVFATSSTPGEMAQFERTANLETGEVSARNEVLAIQDPSHSRRTAVATKKYVRVTLDDIDKLKLLIDPSNEYTAALIDALGATYDQVCYTAMTGTALTGKDGTGTQAFDTSNNQIAHGGTGLTVAKFNQALRILEGGDVNVETTPLFCCIGARGIEDLLGDTTNQLTSFDFQDMKTLSTTRFPSFRGVNVIRTQRVPDSTAGSVYRALMFTSDNVKVHLPSDVTVHMDIRNDMAHVAQISGYMTVGAVRMEEETIVDILYQ